MLEIIALINICALAIALINFTFLQRPATATEISESIAVLLPVRDEIANIERILQQLTAQVLCTTLEIFVVDDHSTDGTAEFLRSYSHPRVHHISAQPLSAGWLGKPNALESGYLAAPDFDIYFTIDADVNLNRDAISRTVATMSGLDFISPYPRQLASTFAERLIQPLLQWSWMSSVILPLAQRFPHPSTAIANGQFFAVRAQVLRELGGFTTIAAEVLDDIKFAKAALRAGFSGSVIEGSAIVETRMYHSLSEIRNGYGKSLYPTFGLIGSFFLALFMFATSILPFFFIFTPFGFIATIAILSTRLLSALSSRNSLIDVIAHPLSASLFIFLLYDSFARRTTITWKGRAV